MMVFPMLTKKDLNNLKNIFVTKEEFKEFEIRFEGKLEKKFRRIFVTKDEFYKTTNEIIELINAVGNRILTELGAKIDDIHAVLENHERRIEKLELRQN